MAKGERTTPLEVDVSALIDPDVATIAALARLHLAAGRLGWRLLFCNAREELRELVEWLGLAGSLPLGPRLALEFEGEIEEREELWGVEEEADPDYPAP